MDDVHVGFESIMEVAKFSVRLAFSDIDAVPEKLLAISSQNIAAKQAALRDVMPRYFYSGYRPYRKNIARMLDMHRGAVAPAALSLGDDGLIHAAAAEDAFGTILQWLNSRIPHTRGATLA